MVVEGEATKPGLHVLADRLGSLGNGRGFRNCPPLRTEALHEGLRILVVFREYERKTDGQQDLRRIPIHRGTVVLENLLLSLQVLEVAAKPVADVAILSKQSQCPPLAASADHDLRTPRLDGAGYVQRTIDLVVRALE